MGDSHTFALKKAYLFIWESNSELLKRQSDFFFFSMENCAVS